MQSYSPTPISWRSCVFAALATAVLVSSLLSAAMGQFLASVFEGVELTLGRLAMPLSMTSPWLVACLSLVVFFLCLCWKLFPTRPRLPVKVSEGVSSEEEYDDAQENTGDYAFKARLAAASREEMRAFLLASSQFRADVPLATRGCGIATLALAVLLLTAPARAMVFDPAFDDTHVQFLWVAAYMGMVVGLLQSTGCWITNLAEYGAAMHEEDVVRAKLAS